MKLIKLLSFVLVALFINACTPVRVVSTDEKEDIDFASYETFNFLDISLKNDSLRQDALPEIQMLKDAIILQMGDLGYSLSDDPDLWVNIGIVVEEKVQTRQTTIQDAPIYIGQRRYHWESEEIVVDEYEEGMVTVDIIDADENERVWEGVAVGMLTENDQKMGKRINDAMELLFNRYPNNVDM